MQRRLSSFRCSFKCQIHEDLNGLDESGKIPILLDTFHRNRHKSFIDPYFQINCRNNDAEFEIQRKLKVLKGSTLQEKRNILHGSIEKSMAVQFRLC